ncbi:TPA: tail length tape measure protein [Bacillus wiedmannii]|nr:tail length tape measure protein [Bacillus wiedmannii]
MADGRVEIDTRLETGNIRRDVQRVNNELSHIGDGVVDAARGLTDEVGARYDSLGRRIRYAYRGTSEEARRMYSEMRSAHYQQAIAMRGVKDQMIGAQYQYFKLAQASKNYTGTTREFMSEVQKAGKAQKAAADAAINANRLAMMGMLQTIGYMQNMTTQATRIRENYARMANPLYTINSAGLRAADGLNRLANAGNASVLALKMLGPTASMKDLRNMTMMITQGLMRFQMVALGAAVTAGLFYAALFKAAKGPDPSEIYKQQEEALTAYRDAVQQRTTEIMNAWSLFEEVQMKKTSGKKLMQNLEEQVGILGRWKDNLASIAQRAGSEFANYLAQMGPQSAEEVKAISKMTEPELQKYVGLWKEKMSLARSQATTELQGLKEETDRKIKELQDSLTPLGLAWERMKGAFVTAIQPMVDAFGMLMTPIVNFAAKMFELITLFNQAHPTLALIIQSIIMLVPALTLLLSPLAIGIGLWNGMLAAWNAIWMLIGPLITGLAAMSATVWVVAAAIVGLVAGFIYLWNTSDGFRNAIIATWEIIKTATAAAWNYILNGVLIPIWNAIVSFGQQLFGQLKEFWQQNGDNIMQIAEAVWSFVKANVINHVTTMVAAVKTVFFVLQSVVQSVWGAIKQIISGALDVILGVIGVFVNVLTGDWEGAWESVKQISSGAWEMMKGTMRLGADAVLGIIKGLGKAFGGVFEDIANSFYNAGKGFMEMLMKGLESMKNKVTSTISDIAGSIRDFLPFSPAKTGPLSDLDHLDFGGPISDSIKLAFPQVSGLMSQLLDLPDITANAPAQGLQNRAVNTTNNNTPISVTLNYNGNGNENDMMHMVDMIEGELSRRLATKQFMLGGR